MPSENLEGHRGSPFQPKSAGPVIPGLPQHQNKKILRGKPTRFRVMPGLPEGDGSGYSCGQRFWVAETCRNPSRFTDKLSLWNINKCLVSREIELAFCKLSLWYLWYRN